MEEAPLEKKKTHSKERSIEAEPEQAAETNSRPPEKLGHMLMTASEKAPISHTGKSALEAANRSLKNLERSVERSLRPSSEKRAATLSRAELMRLSEEIIVDGSSLRQVYETHLIGERGLRRLIVEHEHGGDLKRVLREEIIAREMDFERDPALRDADIPKLTGNDHTKAHKAALNELLEQAAAGLDDTSEEAAFYKARALYEAGQLQQHRQQRRWVDITLAAVIAILIIMVLALLSRQ